MSKTIWKAIDTLFEQDISDATSSDYQQTLDQWAQTSHKHMTTVHHSRVERRWRRLYTDCKLISALWTLRKYKDRRLEDAVILDSIRDLDMAIIVAGSPGNGRNDLIQAAISCLQSCLVVEHSPVAQQITKHSKFEASDATCAANTSVPLLSTLPDLETYSEVCHTSPYVIQGAALEWPCFDQSIHSTWGDASHLCRIAGPGRCVPVEIGRSYLDKDWKQDIIPWAEFLNRIGWSANQGAEEDITYLAQHNLFDQFPTLRSEILVPDLVYSAPSAPPYYPSYKPPMDEEDGLETVLYNAWLGPALTVSPPHRDPYYNIYGELLLRPCSRNAQPTDPTCSPNRWK